MNRFSIILPVRNGGDYFRQCVQSILSQTYPYFNLIILENKSTDDAIQWAATLGDERIIIIPAERSLSIEENWERIKTIPRYEFMTMIGHDDLLAPRYLETISALIDQFPDATLYQAHFTYIDSNGNKVRDCVTMPSTLSAAEFLALQMERKIDSTGTGYMMRAADFDTVGGMPADYSHLIFADFKLWMALIQRGYLAVAPANVFFYRLHQSLSRTTDGMVYQQAFTKYIEFLIDCRRHQDTIAAVIDRHGKSFLEYYCESISHRLLKTPRDKRSITAGAFIRKCSLLAKQFIPGQPFQPNRKLRIWLAAKLDSSSAGRTIFRIAKKVTG